MTHLISVFTLITILFGASFTVIGVKQSLNKNLNSCLSKTTGFNIGRRNSLNKLFSLNLKAKALRTKRLTAERVYKAAPPQAKAAAYAALQAVKIAQKIFRAYQLNILRSLSYQLISFKLKTNSQRFSILKISNDSLVQSFPNQSDSPSYKPTYDFQNKSKVLLRKTFILNKNFPTYFKNLLSSKRGQIECGSNMIFLKSKKIHIKLLGGKSF